MHIHLNDFSINRVILFKEKLFSTLSTEHKIVVIATMALGCLVVCFAISRYCIKFMQKIELKRKNKEQRIPSPQLPNVANRGEVKNLPVIKQSYQISIAVNEKDFQEYLFSSKQLFPQIKTLLQNTVCLATCPSDLITYHHFTLNHGGLDELLQSPPLKHLGKNKITCVPNWFDYANENHFYIDFAHATSFGGAYRSYGCVQEERLFAEFRALALLDFKTNNGIHPCILSDDHKYPPFAKPSPFIIESIHRQFDISKTPYGGKFHRTNSQEIIDGIVKVLNPLPINIIGLAAVDWRCKNSKYRLEDLIYHYEAASLANIGAKKICDQRGWKECVVHTAPWGCGAFLNSELMMTAIQYLAAQQTEVDLVFHGVGNPMNPNYTEKDINETIQWISQLMQDKLSIHQILEVLLEKSQADPKWSPK